MAAYARGPHLRQSAPNDRAVGARPADFQEDSIGHVLVQQRPGDAGGWAGEHRHDGPARNFAHVHYAAVTAHDHQRRRDSGRRYGVRRHLRGSNHPWQNRGVEGCRPRAGAQPVERRNLVPRRCRQPALARVRDHASFARRIVDAERLAHRDSLHAGRGKHVDRAPQFGCIVAAHENHTWCEPHRFGQRDRRKGLLAPRKPSEARVQPDQPHARDVAFQ